VSAALNHFSLEVLDEETIGTIRMDDKELRLISKRHGIDTVGVWCRKGILPQKAAVRLRDFCQRRWRSGRGGFWDDECSARRSSMEHRRSAEI
jgi:hypothetical protein